MGDYYSIAKFIELVASGSINEFDGVGYFVYENGEECRSQVPFDPTDIRRRAKKYHFKGVNWYNK